MSLFQSKNKPARLYNPHKKTTFKFKLESWMVDNIEWVVILIGLLSMAVFSIVCIILFFPTEGDINMRVQAVLCYGGLL